MTALHLAVEGSEMETVRVLIDHKVDVNAVDGKGGRTPLFYACELNDKAMVQLLTEAGADIHLANYAGISPVQVASNRRCTRIVAYLVEHGADNPTVLVSPE
uniref:Uncharacterized protein n=1 Tax=Capitella teleta TaxID=283909 RepID=X2B8U7_CAPTE